MKPCTPAKQVSPSHLMEGGKLITLDEVDHRCLVIYSYDKEFSAADLRTKLDELVPPAIGITGVKRRKTMGRHFYIVVLDDAEQRYRLFDFLKPKICDILPFGSKPFLQIGLTFAERERKRSEKQSRPARTLAPTTPNLPDINPWRRKRVERDLRIGSINMCGVLNKETSFVNILRCGIDILAVQETNGKSVSISGYTGFWSAPNSSNSPTGHGVGILIRKDLKAFAVVPLHRHFLAVTIPRGEYSRSFTGGKRGGGETYDLLENLLVISLYLPPNIKNPEYQQVWDDVKALIASHPNHLPILMGDLNCDLGIPTPDEVELATTSQDWTHMARGPFSSLYDKPNARAKKTVQFLRECNLTSKNGWDQSLGTPISRHNGKDLHQRCIDHIIVHRDLFTATTSTKSVRDLWVDSDHFLIMADVNIIKLPRIPDDAPPPKRMLYNYFSLLAEEATQVDDEDEYKTPTHRRLKESLKKIRLAEANTSAVDLAEATRAALEPHKKAPPTGFTGKPFFWTDEIANKHRVKRSHYRKALKYGNMDDWNKYVAARKEEKKLVVISKREKWNALLDKVATDKLTTKDAWNTIRRLRRAGENGLRLRTIRESPTPQLRPTTTGGVPLKADQILAFFQDVLSSPFCIPPSPPSCSIFS